MKSYLKNEALLLKELLLSSIVVVSASVMLGMAFLPDQTLSMLIR